MAIRDRNGEVYRLRGPNPIMKDQADWDATKVKLINCGGWKSEIVEDVRSPVREMKARTIDIGEELGLEESPPAKVVAAKQFISEVSAPPKSKPKAAPAPPPPEPEPEFDIEIEIVQPDEPVVIEADPRLARLLREKAVEYRCVPVVGQKRHADSFYGEEYETPVYGEQFIFDAVVIDQSDLQLQFWCVKHVGKDSIVHKRDMEGGERWWRVDSSEPKTGGYLVLAVTSDTNPDFS